MAGSGAPDEDEILDPVEAEDEAFDDEDELEGFSDVDPDEPDDLEFDEDDEDVEEIDEPDDLIEAEEDVGEADLPALLTEEDEIAAVVAATEEDEDEDDDTLREGEFICQSCFMAKRDSALADEDAMLCRDCV